MFIIIEHEGDEVKGIMSGYLSEFMEFDTHDKANEFAETHCVTDYTIVEIT